MHYYKSQELADLYGVSRRTVTNWIKQTREGKLDLELDQDKDEFYIIKSRFNQQRLESIVSERRKYLNQQSRKVLTPSPEFYQQYNETQIHDIIKSLNSYRELPLQYSYFGEGAKMWEVFRTQPERHMDPETLLKAVSSYITHAIEQYDAINIVDLGVGTGAAARPLIEQLHKAGKLNRYIGIDISQAMIDITTRNISQWFNNEVKVETHIKDISHELFSDIIAEPIDEQDYHQKTINIVLSLGGYISNFRHPEDILRTISRSMNPEDLYICSFRLDAPAVKNQVSFLYSYQKQCKLVLDMMGIKESLYNVEVGFDEEARIRYARIRPKYALTIEFKLSKGTWIVNLNKDEAVLTARAHFNSTFGSPKDLFYKNGFNPLLYAQRLNHEGAILIADLK